MSLSTLERLGGTSARKNGDPYRDLATSLGNHVRKVFSCNGSFKGALSMLFGGGQDATGFLRFPEGKMLHVLESAKLKRPTVVVVDGKPSEFKLDAMARLLGEPDTRILLGPHMVLPCLAAQGFSTGSWEVDETQRELSRLLWQKDRNLQQIVWPSHVRIMTHAVQDRASQGAESSKRQTLSVPTLQIPKGSTVVDIGPRTVSDFAKYLTMGGTIVWVNSVGVPGSFQTTSSTVPLARAIAQSSRWQMILEQGVDGIAATRKAIEESLGSSE